MLVDPTQFLLGCLAIAFVAIMAQWMMVRIRRTALRKFAAAHGFHFAPNDRFRLADRAAAEFPAPSVDRPRVSDVLYARRGEVYCYAFRFDYTASDADRARRLSAIVGTSEPRRPMGDERAPDSILKLHVAKEYRDVIGDLPAAPEENTQD